MITFEKVQEADIEIMTEVKLRAFAPELEKYHVDPSIFCSPDWTRQAIHQGDFYKILLDAQVVGGLHVFVFGDAFYACHELNSIFILPEYQSQGIGSRAIQFLAEAYPFAHKWRLETPSLSFGNHHFYEKNGFVKVREVCEDEIGVFIYYREN
jgi:GNAT superfamily N-acetyltransferase